MPLINYKLLGYKEYQGACHIRFDNLKKGFDETRGLFWIKCTMSRPFVFQATSKRVRDTVFDALQTLCEDQADERLEIDLYPIGALAKEIDMEEQETSNLNIKLKPIEELSEESDEDDDDLNEERTANPGSFGSY